MRSHTNPATDSPVAADARAAHHGEPGGPLDPAGPGALATPTGWALPIITVLGTAAAIVAAFFGSGAMGGTPIAEAAGGVLSADATPVAPAASAFSIWSVIYIGLAAYALWQLTPTARRSARQAALRPWALASVLLNAAWIWAVQLELILGSVIVIVLLLAVLVRILYILGAPRIGGIPEAVVTDGTFGLYLGWVSVAFFANTFAWLASAGVDVVTSVPFGIVGIVVAAGVGVATALISGGRIPPALATAWGLAWVAYGRASGEHESAALVWTAAIASVVVVVVALGRRLSGLRRERGRGAADRAARRPA
ncbi:tryptophan-rich sensory protein [Dietzia sp. oral taxon 368]|uniref:tryptophan-rich sensory protein n=1 Tax=Dietzia sp. oral taxon 368 TaxID=712270 RepID=UPI000D0895A4|nr:tryptophan-rich sensory protein [Dietzia sp. oral taxon 368]AVM63865.1 tryptophan-rich sensory protein [Dietzia sp. oral taxon 368]